MSIKSRKERENTSHGKESMPKAKRKSVGSAELYFEMDLVIMSLQDEEQKMHVRKEIVDIARSESLMSGVRLKVELLRFEKTLRLEMGDDAGGTMLGIVIEFLEGRVDAACARMRRKYRTKLKPVERFEGSRVGLFWTSQVDWMKGPGGGEFGDLEMLDIVIEYMQIDVTRAKDSYKGLVAEVDLINSHIEYYRSIGAVVKKKTLEDLQVGIEAKKLLLFRIKRAKEVLGEWEGNLKRLKQRKVRVDTYGDVVVQVEVEEVVGDDGDDGW